MSYSFAKGAWEVRWRDANDRQRSRRFKGEEAAIAWDDAMKESTPTERRPDTTDHGSQGGVYPYETKNGTRWRYVARRSDGTPTSKRGFTSPRAARDAKRQLTEKVERGELRHTKHTFGSGGTYGCRVASHIWNQTLGARTTLTAASASYRSSRKYR